MKTPLQRVKNPTGRLDWLAAKLLERAVEQRQNPVVNAIYAEVKAPLENLMRMQLGPRSKRARQVRKYIAQANQILQSVQQRRMA